MIGDSTKFQYVTDDVILGRDVRLGQFVNLYGCQIGDQTKVGSFTEIQAKVTVGHNCKICTNTVICTGVQIGNNCFIGNGTIFINDNHPRAVNESGALETWQDWKDRFVSTTVCDNVCIGSNCTILGGITIGRGAIIGAGSVVTKSVPENETWVGNPAKKIQHKLAIIEFGK